MSIYIGVGSSIGNAQQIFETAINTLKKEGVFVLQRSKPFLNPPFGGIAQNDFTNEVWQIKTTLPPIALMRVLQSAEDTTKRDRTTRWADRPLDLDILTYNNITLNLPELKIPHPGIPNRSFVLIPWADLVPNNFSIPIFGHIFKK